MPCEKRRMVRISLRPAQLWGETDSRTREPMVLNTSLTRAIVSAELGAERLTDTRAGLEIATVRVPHQSLPHLTHRGHGFAAAHQGNCLAPPSAL